MKPKMQCVCWSDQIAGIGDVRNGVTSGDACAELRCPLCPRKQTCIMCDGIKPGEAAKRNVAALPVSYRTTKAEPTFESLTEKDPECVHSSRSVAR